MAKTRYWRSHWGGMYTSKADLGSHGRYRPEGETETAPMYVEITKEEYLAWREAALDTQLRSQVADIRWRNKLRLERAAKKLGMTPRQYAGRILDHYLDRWAEKEENT